MRVFVFFYDERSGGLRFVKDAEFDSLRVCDRRNALLKARDRLDDDFMMLKEDDEDEKGKEGYCGC